MSLIAPINAINSWEGYEYQGHVALFVVLFELKDIILNKGSIDEYELQIEGEEDFSLLHSGSYKSLHQVKSGSIDLNDNDKFAFIAEIIQNNADYGYFHVTTSNSIPTNFLDRALAIISSLQVEFKKRIVSKEELSATDNFDDYIVLEFVTPIHKKATKYSIIKYVTNGEKDRASVKAAITSINKELQDYLYLISNKKRQFLDDNSGLSEDQSFLNEWPQKFDNSKEVRTQGIQCIKDIIEIVQPKWIFADNKYCGFLYDEGMLLIKRYVTDFFIQKDKNGKCIIPYTEFYDLIFHDYYHDYASGNIEFKYYLMLKKIDDVFYTFTQSSCNQNYCEQCTQVASCNLLKQFKVWSDKGNEGRHQFIFNLLLQAPTMEISNLPNDETIKIQLMELVKDISRVSLNEKNVISTSLNKEFYWLSLDESRRQETLRDKIQKGIKENPDKSFLYECDTLITSFLNNENFKIDGSNINVLEKEQLEEINTIVSTNIDDEKANCNKPKIIRLVDADKAKGELL